MTTDAARLLEDALQLGAPERAEIAEELLFSLDDDRRQQIEAAWLPRSTTRRRCAREPA